MTDQDQIENQSPQEWPDSLDALIAAPKHHTLLFQNDRVRVLETRIPRGDTTAVHTHRWASAIHTLSWSDFIRRDGNGKILLDTRVSKSKPPEFAWSDPLPPHSIENVGEGEIRLIMVELKTVELKTVELKDQPGK
jgi:quercetin dioxygenase-like cupin family protein